MTSIMRFDKWENSLGVPYQAILQVVHFSVIGLTTITSTSFAATPLVATITPKYATSKILVLVNAHLETPSGGAQLYPTVFRGTTAGVNLGDGNSGFGGFRNSGGTSDSAYGITALDSPSTTSSQVYTFAFRVTANTGYMNGLGGESTITLIEIAQ